MSSTSNQIIDIAKSSHLIGVEENFSAHLLKKCLQGKQIQRASLTWKKENRQENTVKQIKV